MLRGETQENLHQKITLAQPSKILLKDYSQMLYRFFLFSLFRFAHPNSVFPYFFELFSRSILFPAFPLAPIFDFDVTQILNFTCRNILHTRSNFIENEKIKKKYPKRSRALENYRKKNGIRCAFERFVLFNINLL